MSENKTYEVALSLAGEQRGYVEEVARFLQSRGVGIFYDEFESVRLWGNNIAEELQDIYENRAELSIMFISKEYVSKLWPIHERRAILSRLIQERQEYILPVRFDDSPVPGLPTATKHLSADEHSPAELATMIVQKLGMLPFAGKASDVPPPRMTSLIGEAVFDYSNHNGRYVIGHGNLSFETMWSRASGTSIHVCNDPPSVNGVALARGCDSITEVTEAAKLDFTSRCRTPQRGGIVVFRNLHGFYAAVHVLDIKDDTRNDDRDEIRFRYLIQANGTDTFTELGSEEYS